MPARRHIPAPVALLTLLAALVAALVAGIAFGAVPVAPGEVLSAIGRALAGHSAGISDTLIIDVRLPRVILAALVGASLAGAGVLYQALFRNPLADPYILGVSSGAGLGAMVAIAATASAAAWRFGVVPLASFAGAILTMALVVRLASLRGRFDMTSLLLAGVAISYTLSALTSFIMVFAREQMAQVVFWMMGGLGGASWRYVAMVAPMFLFGAAAPMIFTRDLDLMLLGDERAGQLGVPVDRLRRMMLASASLLTAAAVAVAGLIGFVGLMTPHMVRLILGPGHRALLPASMLTGATVLVLADLAARVVLAPVEIPVGIVTAVLGGPFFVYLLIRREGVR